MMYIFPGIDPVLLGFDGKISCKNGVRDAKSH